MELHRCKSFFLSLLVLAPAFGQAANSELTVFASSETEFRFTCAFRSDLSDLQKITTADSSVAFCRVIPVAVPPGATARVISALGRSVRPWTSKADLPLQLAGSDRLADLAPPVMVRGRSIIGVRIYPVVSDGVYSEVEVHLVFDRVRRLTALATADDSRFDRILSSVVANFDVAADWPVLERSPARLVGAMPAANDLAAASRWYKITVNQTGLHRVTGAQLEAAGIPVGNLFSDSIRIFNAGGLPNPVENSQSRPTFDEIAILVQDGGDDLFNQNDEIIFYGEAVDRWLYRTDYPPAYMNNPYTGENVYWLAVSGDFGGLAERMEQVDASPTGPVDMVITSFWRNVHIEQDRLISREYDGHIMDYYNWFWTDSLTFTLYVATPGALPSDSANLFVDARSGRNVDLSVNGVSALGKVCNQFNCRYYTYALLGGPSELNRFDMQLDPVSSYSPPYLNFLEIKYQSRLEPTGDRLDITLDNVDARAELQVVDNFTSEPMLFDISDPGRPLILTGFERSGGLVRFEGSLTVLGPNRFYLSTVSQAAAPAAVKAADFTDIRASLPQADMIIVTGRVLAPYLEEYIAYREGQGHPVHVVTVEDVMDNFSYGLYDPTAIRDYLKYAYESFSAPAPSVALFVGDASYDFMNNTGSDAYNIVPSYIRPDDRTYSDDNYVYFGDYGLLDSDTSFPAGDCGFDMMSARWPVRSRGEIDVVLAKVKAYESPTGFGTWRSRVTLVADDEFGKYDNEVIHTEDTELLSQDHIPRFFTRDKIYMWEYPRVNREKPDVNRAIVDAFNEGSLIVNYVGHGNPDVWAHEHVLERSTDLPHMTNADRLPLVFAASCAIGFFDDPRREGMAEDFLAMASGGAIGIVSATRLVYASDNAAFNRVVYDNLLYTDSLTICEAVFAGKLERQYLSGTPRKVDNDRAYTFFGDPYLRLGVPILDMEFAQTPDSLVALGQSRVTGWVVDAVGNPVVSDGTLLVSVFDSDRERVYRLVNDSGRVIHTTEYNVSGPAIYRGSASISGGNFDFRFITPLDISYRATTARISVYAVFDNIDGVGLVDSLPVSAAPAAVTDSVGPRIEYAIVGRSNFVSGDAVTTDESLKITLSDPIGINLAGGLGHGISLVIDGQTEKAVNLTNLFEYEKDDFTSGELEYGLSALTPGEHRLKIKAWDNANNMSADEFSVEVLASGQLAINELLNYPNPMGAQTTFYFELTQMVEKFSLGIYTLSGKNIWNYNRYGLPADNYPNDNVRVVWNGRDADGDRVGTGVYIYKATAVTRSGGEQIEKFGKVVVLN